MKDIGTVVLVFLEFLFLGAILACCLVMVSRPAPAPSVAPCCKAVACDCKTCKCCKACPSGKGCCGD